MRGGAAMAVAERLWWAQGLSGGGLEAMAAVGSAGSSPISVQCE